MPNVFNTNKTICNPDCLFSYIEVTKCEHSTAVLSLRVETSIAPNNNNINTQCWKGAGDSVLEYAWNHPVEVYLMWHYCEHSSLSRKSNLTEGCSFQQADGYAAKRSAIAS